MPNWLIVVILVVLILPGAAIILGGVAAMFFAPAEYDKRMRWEAEGKCPHCGNGETIERSSVCPGCGKERG